MVKETDLTCYDCKHSYWESDHHGTSLYCPIRKEYNTGERHLQGKIYIIKCHTPIPKPKTCRTCGQIIREVET